MPDPSKLIVDLRDKVIAATQHRASALLEKRRNLRLSFFVCHRLHSLPEKGEPHVRGSPIRRQV